MIKVLLSGGLGNQMFQYAFAKALSIELDQELLLDCTFLNYKIPMRGFTYRKFDLDLFDIKDRKYTFLDYPVIRNGSYLIKSYYDHIVKKENVCKEKEEDYYTYSTISVFDKTSHIVIDGYWQNYKYFEKYRDTILQSFQMQLLYDQQYDVLEREITSPEYDSVSIHVRKGDYTSSLNRNLFVQLSKKYYQLAIDYMISVNRRPRFYIFSYDDPGWLETEINFHQFEHVVIDRNYKGDRFKTYMRLMSLCKNNIISNSSFAFWSTYLNNNPNKQVVYPKYWTYHGNEFEYKGFTIDGRSI